MLSSSHGDVPPISLGMTSITLGFIGAGLFFLPILAIPVAAAGLLFGVAGVLVGRSRPAARRARWLQAVDWQTREEWRLRRSLLGVLLCSAAIVNGFILGYAPLGYLPKSSVQPLWQSPPGRVFVPPPALPGRTYQPRIATAAEKPAAEKPAAESPAAGATRKP